MKSAPVVIVLAAGAGSRFRGHNHKLTQPFGASSILGTTLSNAIASHLPVIVVTTTALRDLAKSWVATQDVVIVPQVDGQNTSHLGMGYSIAAGVRARGDAAGWLVLPGDMPLVQASTMRHVAQGLSDHSVAYAQHLGRRGHPVAFSAELYSELATLTGDEGARRLLARYPAAAVEVADAGVLIDLDTEADLQAMRHMHRS